MYSVGVAACKCFMSRVTCMHLVGGDAHVHLMGGATHVHLMGGATHVHLMGGTTYVHLVVACKCFMTRRMAYMCLVGGAAISCFQMSISS